MGQAPGEAAGNRVGISRTVWLRHGFLDGSGCIVGGCFFSCVAIQLFLPAHAGCGQEANILMAASCLVFICNSAASTQDYIVVHRDYPLDFICWDTQKVFLPFTHRDTEHTQLDIHHIKGPKYCILLFLFRISCTYFGVTKLSKQRISFY